MTITIGIGWWMLPAAVTVAAFVWRWWVHKDDVPSSGYGRIGDGIAQLLTISVALVFTRAAWLVWALLR